MWNASGATAPANHPAIQKLTSSELLDHDEKAAAINVHKDEFRSAISSLCSLPYFHYTVSVGFNCCVSKTSKSDTKSTNRPHVPSSTRSLLPLFLAENTDNDSSKGENEEFEKAVRIAKAKAEIDQILKGPDAPFDLQGEIKNVEGISPPLASKEQKLDDQVSELEKELYAAVEQQDYVLASQKKEEIGKMHVDDCGAVLQVNSAFYRAFSDKDYDAMEKLWLKDGSSLCIHPSHPPMVGVNAVLRVGRTCLITPVDPFNASWMSPSQHSVSSQGCHCDCHLRRRSVLRRFVRGKEASDGTRQQADGHKHFS